MKQKPEGANGSPWNAEAQIDLSLIDDGLNVRTNVDRLTEENDELVQSILANGGVLQPVGVFPSGERFVLIFGQRRVLCSRIAGMTTIRARIFAPPQDDAELLILGTQENSHRVDANPVEFAEALKTIKQIRNWSSDEVAKAVCLKPVKVCRLLKLAEQSDAIKQLVRDGRLAMTSALELGKLTQAEQHILLPQIVAGQVTRDQLVGLRKRQQRADSANTNRTGRRISRATAPITAGRTVTVTVTDAVLDWDTYIPSLEQCLHLARKCRTSGMTLVTYQRMLRDQQTTSTAEGTV